MAIQVKVKQDSETLAQLDRLAAAFPTQVQPLLDQAPAESDAAASHTFICDTSERLDRTN
jgi:hypothetical protein